MTRIRVPATSANLGPGFDALGVALRLYCRFEAEEGEGLSIEGCPEEFRGSDNLFVRAFRSGLEELGRPYRGLRLRIDSDIPPARGLGSSAACVVGGLLAASLMAGGPGSGPRGALGEQGIADLASKLEGHPDNALPALLGGFAVSILEEGRTRWLRTPLRRSKQGRELSFMAMVPPFPLSTAKARAALPASVPFKDASRNAGRSALVAASFALGDYSLLGPACDDRLHEPYRKGLIPGFDRARAAALEAGALAVYLSGAGPTIMALVDEDGPAFRDRLAPTLATMEGGAWELLQLSADDEGAVEEPSPEAS